MIGSLSIVLGDDYCNRHDGALLGHLGNTCDVLMLPSVPYYIVVLFGVKKKSWFLGRLAE